jgi:hypothetical protein
MLRGTHPPPPPATPGSTVAWAKIVRVVTGKSFDELQSTVAAMTKAPIREMIVIKAAMQAAGITLVKGDDGRVRIETTDRPDMRAVEWLANREEGAPVQSIETTIIDPRPPLTPEAASEAARKYLKNDEEAGEV